jgi:geranylgeranylglycerol-phosphate geranylgeranyltransferase
MALIRFPGPLILASATILGMVVNAGLLPDPVALAVGVVSTFSLSGAAFALNDYFDLEIDVINNPDRPLPAGLLLPKEAFRLGLLLSLIGIAVPSIIDLKATMLALSVCLSRSTIIFMERRPGS